MEEAVEKLTPEECKKKLLSLLDIARCAVCLECVRKDMVQCVNGHLLCSDCKDGLEICPTCREKFSLSKPSHFVSQVIDILTTHCKYRNCPTIIRNDDDHEKYCGFKPTNCKLCPWICPGRDIYSHCKKRHGYSLATNGESLFNSVSDREYSHFLIRMVEFEPQSQFFWEETLNDPVTKTFSKIWHMVPNGKPTCDYFVTLSFKSKSGPFMETKIKLNLDSDGVSEDNKILLTHRMLSHFIDEGNLLIYSVKMSLV